MEKINDTEISSRDKKLVAFYEKKLEINPDTAIEKTMIKFNREKSRVRGIVSKYSQYPTPTAYKKMLKDIDATASIIADDIVDKELNKEYDGLITNNDMASLVRGFKNRGIDVKGMFAEFLQAMQHDNLREMTGDSLVTYKKNIPIRKTLKQKVDEENLREEFAKAKKNRMTSERDIFYFEESGKILEGGGLQTDEGADNPNYDKDYEERTNDFMTIYLYLQTPNMNKNYASMLIQQFVIKWYSKHIQAEAMRQRRAKETNRKIITIEEPEWDDIEEEEDLSEMTLEELKELEISLKGDVDTNRF